MMLRAPCSSELGLPVPNALLLAPGRREDVHGDVGNLGSGRRIGKDSISLSGTGITMVIL
jgi:hypothetical protein